MSVFSFKLVCVIFGFGLVSLRLGLTVSGADVYVQGAAALEAKLVSVRV